MDGITIKHDLKRFIFAAVRATVRLFDHRHIWLVSDREDAAGDNGEAFFKYLQTKNENSFFGISKTSPDYERMKQYGKVVDINSLRFFLMMCSADVYISSHDLHMKDHTEHVHIFLQHGVALTNLSKYFNLFVHKKVYVIASSDMERYELYNTTALGASQICVTGLPRFDYLDRDASTNGNMTICLTWRLYISEYMSEEDFKKEKYYKAICDLFEDKEFIQRLNELGYSLSIKLRPKMQKYISCVSNIPNIQIEEENYNEMLNHASMLITDYSSVAVDFAYLHKPVIYFHFDEDKYYSGHTSIKSDWSFEEKGFGEVVYSAEDLKAVILKYASNGCCMDDKYKLRIDSFIKYSDRCNSERVYEYVKGILDSKRSL